MKMSDLAEAYEKHADALIRFAATLVGPANAEDVVSEAVLGALRANLDRVDDLEPYLYRCVANAAKKHWRAASRHDRREALALRSAVVSDVEASDSAEIGLALAELSPQQRAIAHLRYWEDLTPAAIAIRLGTSVGTVKRQLARANKKLSEVLLEVTGHG